MSMLAATGIPFTPADLRRLARGSAFRGGQSLVALGATGGATIAVGASEEIPIPVRESGFLGKLVVAALAAELDTLTITSIKHNNDELISGESNARIFSHDSEASPGFGHWVSVSDELSVTVKNNGAAATTVPVNVTFSTYYPDAAFEG